MARTRFAWHLFAASLALVTAATIGCFWLASLELARLADAAHARRLEDVASALSGMLAEAAELGEPTAFAAAARRLTTGLRASVDLLAPDGTTLVTVGPRSGPQNRPRSIDALLTESRKGRMARASHYDAASGKRIMVVAAPAATAAETSGTVLIVADTAAADADLARSQRWLLLACLAWALVALATGSAVALRMARPVADLSQAAARLARGDVAVAIPAVESAELVDLADAIGSLREQLVERGLTIGRQGTQQAAVLGSMIEGVLAIDGRQRVVGINNAAADLLGVDPSRAIGRNLQAVVRNPDLRRFALRAIDCREPVEDDLLIHGMHDRTIRLRGTALRDPSGDGGAVIVLNDVTEVQRLENIRRDFVANVSHELKTPIASIKGFVETLLDGAADDPTDRRRFLDIIARQSDRLTSIIEDLLTLSRIERSEGAGELPRERVRVVDLLAAVTDDCLPRAQDRSIRLAVACDAAAEADVNPPLLEQALMNLVDNAIKYSDPGSTVHVAVVNERPPTAANATLVITVRDQGCGIAAEHLPRLFERFYRVDKGRSRKVGGTGLGLSIVKHIVQAHDGSVDVESTPGAGSTFTIRLPMPAEAPAAA